jgi:hypothetical protein
MKDIIQEVLANDQWCFENGHEWGEEMLAEEMNLHDDLDYDDDTALDCFELAQALDNLELAHLNDEHNIVAPEGIIDTQDEVEMVDSDVSDHPAVEVIDVDAYDSESVSELGTVSSQIMEIE